MALNRPPTMLNLNIFSNNSNSNSNDDSAPELTSRDNNSSIDSNVYFLPQNQPLCMRGGYLSGTMPPTEIMYNSLFSSLTNSTILNNINNLTNINNRKMDTPKLLNMIHLSKCNPNDINSSNLQSQLQSVRRIVALGCKVSIGQLQNDL